MTTKNSSTGTSLGKDFVITRIFDATRELVWKAWTDPKQVAKWWGPHEFTTPVCKIDFRVGGKYLFCMTSPEFLKGKRIWITGVYREIAPMKRIVYTDSFADAKGNWCRLRSSALPTTSLLRWW